MVGGARSRRLLLPAVLAGTVVAGAVGLVAVLRPPGASSTIKIEESGVRVSVLYVGDDSGEVVAVFTPLESGFHLYGPDLPRDGINGAGRPTLLELSNIPGWRVAGPLLAEPAVFLQSLPAFDRPFPVFPDGPVTMRLPVGRTASTSDRLTVEVSYMACSSSGLCLAPVTGRSIELLVAG